MSRFVFYAVLLVMVVGCCAEERTPLRLLPEDLTPRCAIEREQVGEIAVHRMQAERRIRQHREKGDNPGAGEHGQRLR